jgi:phage terminase large subunit GpA-like protein
MRDFIEEEIYIPKGRFRGERFRFDRQPFALHWVDAVDSGRWPRHAATGCTQSGKTILIYVIPALYYIFEQEETVVNGLPDMNMASDKWKLDFLPVINRTQYSRFLPVAGAGSRGGEFNSINFRNGPTMKYMSAGGSDKKRAHFETRVVVMTEVDGFDTSGTRSEETDKVSQIEARTLSYSHLQRRIFLECTVTTEKGRIWRELLGGTNSKIVCPCPHCGEGVTPEREHLQGWQKAKSKMEAYREAYFICPSCGNRLTEKERRKMNVDSWLVHQNDPDETDTFSMRWNAFNNMFWVAGDIAIKEWMKEHEEDEVKQEEMERELRQYFWAIPYEPPQVDLTVLDYRAINARRESYNPRGEVPSWAEYVVGGVDLKKRLGHYLFLALTKTGKGVIFDYGIFEIPSDSLGVDLATETALKNFKDRIDIGYPIQGSTKRAIPSLIGIDTGYSDSRDAVYRFCQATGQQRYRPIKGFGEQWRKSYYEPKGINNKVVHIGTRYHISYIQKDGIFLIEIDADHWKTIAHENLAKPLDQEGGGITLFDSPDRNEHISIAKHFTAEKKVVEYIPGRGEIIKWLMLRRQNHWFDCLYIALTMAHLCGVRRIKTEKPKSIIKVKKKRGFRMPDGRRYLITER